MPRLRSSLLIILLVASRAAVTCGEEVPPQQDPLQYNGPARAGDSVWLVDTTSIKKVTAESPGLEFSRYRALDWEASDIKALQSEDVTNTRTVVFVHGYDYTPEKAERMGWAMYHTLVADMPADQKLRLVTWCWPSTGIKFRMLRDMKSKLRRANVEAYFLAWFLSRVDADAVIGTAMGCRIVSGACQLLAGDAATLNTEVARDLRSGKLQVVLISAAIADDWLLPGRAHGEALSQVRQMVLLNNSMDPMLAKFGMVTAKDAEALGVEGIETDKLGEFGGRLSQFDLASAIGEQHGVENYLRSPETSTLLRQFVLAAN